MKSSLKTAAVTLAFLVAAFPLSACSQKASEKKTGFGGASGRDGSDSSQTEIVGKVTSVIGNQVVLALGTLNGGSEKNGDTARSSGGAADRSTQADASSSSGAQPESSGSSSASSDEITLTGKTATLLIPVGLTISDNNSRRASKSGASGGNGGAQGGSGAPGGSAGMPGGGSGGSGSASGSKGTASGSTMTMGSLQRSKDFSSITKGMILKIAESKQSDGTESVLRVTVVSE